MNPENQTRGTPRSFWDWRNPYLHILVAAGVIFGAIRYSRWRSQRDPVPGFLASPEHVELLKAIAEKFPSNRMSVEVSETNLTFQVHVQSAEELSFVRRLSHGKKSFVHFETTWEGVKYRF